MWEFLFGKKIKTTCNHRYVKVGDAFRATPFPSCEVEDVTVLYCPICKQKKEFFPNEASLLLECQKVDEEWRSPQKKEGGKNMAKKELLSIINDLIADNDFNTDEISKRSIDIDIDNLCKELKITTRELQQHQLEN